MYTSNHTIWGLPWLEGILQDHISNILTSYNTAQKKEAEFPLIILWQWAWGPRKIELWFVKGENKCLCYRMYIFKKKIQMCQKKYLRTIFAFTTTILHRLVSKSQGHLFTTASSWQGISYWVFSDGQFTKSKHFENCSMLILI